MERSMKRNSDDRFSSLPDEIVHHILAHLPMRALAQLSTLSRRCRELCISNPTLIFCSEDTSSEGSSRREFCNFIDRLMALRCFYKVKTQRFDLKWTYQTTSDDEEYRVCTWLQHAVNSSVEEVCLEIREPPKSFSLPPFILCCKSIRSLKIWTYPPLRLPSSLLVPSFVDKLQTLHLMNLEINNESIGEWFSSFKSLRELMLRIRGIETITITNSSVETLAIFSSDDDLQKIDIQKVQKLKYLSIKWSFKWSFNSSSSKSMKISTPNLQKLSIEWITNNSLGTSLEISALNLQIFELFGFIVDNYCVKNFPNLESASVGLLPSVGSRANHASTKHNLEKVLHSIQRAQILNLWDSFVKVLCRHDCLPFLFDNLKELTIRKTLSIVPSELLSSLLRGLSNLKHLILVPSSSFSKELSFGENYIISEGSVLTCHLKTVAVKLFNGEEEMELIKQVFKNAGESKTVTVLYTSPISQGFITEFRGFKFCRTQLRSYLESLEHAVTKLR